MYRMGHFTAEKQIAVWWTNYIIKTVLLHDLKYIFGISVLQFPVTYSIGKHIHVYQYISNKLICSDILARLIYWSGSVGKARGSVFISFNTSISDQLIKTGP